MFFNAKKLAKKQVYWKTDAHQDWRSMQGSLNSMVVWVALADIDTSLGALEVIPESHKLGLQTTEMVDSFGLIPDDLVKGNQFVPVEVRKGDVLFFSSLLIHQSGDNSTEMVFVGLAILDIMIYLKPVYRTWLSASLCVLSKSRFNYARLSST